MAFPVVSAPMAVSRRAFVHGPSSLMYTVKTSLSSATLLFVHVCVCECLFPSGRRGKKEGRRGTGEERRRGGGAFTSCRGKEENFVLAPTDGD